MKRGALPDPEPLVCATSHSSVRRHKIVFLDAKFASSSHTPDCFPIVQSLNLRATLSMARTELLLARD